MSNDSDRERQDLLETLAKHRGFLRQTITGMSDEQIRATPTVSALCLGASCSTSPRWRCSGAASSTSAPRRWPG